MKLKIKTLFLSILLLVGCNKTNNSTTNTFEVKVDYGIVENEKATILLDYCSLFNMEEYGIYNVVAGDKITINTKNNLSWTESYPGTINVNKARITSIEVEHGKVIEYRVIESEENEKILFRVDVFSGLAYDFETSINVINQDYSYSKIEDYEIGTKLYGIVPSGKDDYVIRYMYSYYPINDDNKNYYLDINSIFNENIGLEKNKYYNGNELLSFKLKNNVKCYAYLNEVFIEPIRSDNEYDYYEFNMPKEDSSLDIGSEKFFLDIDYSLINLYPQLSNLSSSSIKEFKIETIAIGVGPDVIPTIESTTDKSIISEKLQLLYRGKLQLGEDPQILGGSKRTLIFVDNNDNEYKIEIQNGYIHYVDENTNKWFIVTDIGEFTIND